MKKKILITTALLALTMTGCAKPTENPIPDKANLVEIKSVEPTINITAGRYYTNGTVITNDGNIWNYSQDIISDKPAYDNEPIYALIDDNCTPHTIEDDIIKGIVLDRETAIYDALEAEFSNDDTFSIERTGNNIKISIAD